MIFVNSSGFVKYIYIDSCLLQCETLKLVPAIVGFGKNFRSHPGPLSIFMALYIPSFGITTKVKRWIFLKIMWKYGNISVLDLEKSTTNLGYISQSFHECLEA